MAPMAGGVSDGQQDRLVDLTRLGQRLIVPGPPVQFANLDSSAFPNQPFTGMVEFSPRGEVSAYGEGEAEIRQGEISITVTPTEIAANRLDLSLSTSISGEKITVRMLVSKEIPGKILWETRTDTMEVRVTLASGL